MKKCDDIPEVGQIVLVHCNKKLAIGEVIQVRPKNKTRRFEARCGCHGVTSWWRFHHFPENDSDAKQIQKALKAWELCGSRLRWFGSQLKFSPVIIAKMKVQGWISE